MKTVKISESTKEKETITSAKTLMVTEKRKTKKYGRRETKGSQKKSQLSLPVI